MFEKSQQNFGKLLLKCTEDHKIKIRKRLCFTEDRRTFCWKTLRKSVKRLKTVIGKTKWALQDQKKILTKREKKQYFDEKNFRSVKRVRFEEIVEVCRKIHKVKIKINKKQKSYLKIDEKTCEKETKAAGDEHRVKNTKKLPKSERNASKVKTASENWKSIEKIKEFTFSKKVFRYLKEITNFLNKALESEANRQSWTNTNNSNKVKIWKLQKKFGNKRWKTKKKIVKNRKQMLKKEKTSNSDIRNWCLKKSLRVISKYFWNAKYWALLRKTVKIEE